VQHRYLLFCINMLKQKADRCGMSRGTPKRRSPAR